MKTRELQPSFNPRVRSFLSPYSKYGTRSLSTSQSYQNFSITSYQPQKSYIDFKRATRPQVQTVKLPIRLKFDNFQKRENRKQARLTKITINKIQESSHKQGQKNDENRDLLVMIKQLKERIKVLQQQNGILLQKQSQDLLTISKQDQIIKNLQQAIKLSRIQATFAPRINKTNSYPQSKQLEFALQMHMNQIKQQNLKLTQKYMETIEQLKKYKLQFKPKSKPASEKLKQIQNCNNFEHILWERALKQIQSRKLKQLQEIDELLLGEY